MNKKHMHIFLLILSLIIFSCNDNPSNISDDDDDVTMPDIPTEGLIHCYLFSGNARDIGSDPHNGTVNGAVLCSGHRNEPDSAYSFDGSSTIGLDFYNLTESCTISLWIKTTEFSGGFINWREEPFGLGCDSYSIGIYDGYIDLSFSNGATGGSVSGTSLRNDGVWTHVVITIEDISTTGTIRIIINGVPEATHDTTSLSSINDNVNTLLFGRNFTGAIDNICIYNRILSGEEIGDLYFNG